MNEFLKKVRELLAESRNKLAEALDALPAGDKLVVDGPVRNLISDQKWILKSLEEAADLVADDSDAVTAAQKAVIAAAILDGSIFDAESLPDLLAKRISEDGLVTPAEVETQVNAAREEGKNEVAEELESARTLAARRATALEEHGQSVMAMSDEDFLAEDHEARVTMFAGRLATLDEVGVTEDKVADRVSIYCSAPLTEEGSKSFDGQIAGLRAAIAAATGTPADGDTTQVQAGAQAPKKNGTPSSVSTPILSGAKGKSPDGEEKPAKALII